LIAFSPEARKDGQVRVALFLIVLLCAPFTLWANDITDPPPALPNRAQDKNPSKVEPPPANDHTFVINEDPHLDGPLRYGNSLVISIPITRYTGKTKNNGVVGQDELLTDAQALVNAGYLSAYAEVQIMAYDVDPEELDLVSYVGSVMTAPNVKNLPDDRGVPHLRGENNKWALCSFQIPIEKLQFPKAPGTNGQLPTAATGYIRIEIDSRAGGNPAKWCSAVDWVAVSFKTMSPIVLVHGINESGHIFQPPPPSQAQIDKFKLTANAGQGFTSYLDQSPALLWDASVDLDPGNTLAEGAKKLASQLPKIAKQFGVDSINLVAHSHGGLDVRQYLETDHDPKKLQIVSFTTLSTPHSGSILADIIVEQNAVQRRNVTIKFDPADFPENTAAVAKKMDFSEGYRDLQTTTDRSQNANFILDKFPDADKKIIGTVGADMDLNSSGEIEFKPTDEYKELRDERKSLKDEFAKTYMIGPNGDERTRIGVNVLYQILKTISHIEQVAVKNGWDVLKVSKKGPNPNDVLVTIKSAHGRGTRFTEIPTYSYDWTGTTGKNHASICGRDSARILTTPNPAAGETSWIIEAEKKVGDLK